jgi:hypothetical protein
VSTMRAKTDACADMIGRMEHGGNGRNTGNNTPSNAYRASKYAAACKRTNAVHRKLTRGDPAEDAAALDSVLEVKALKPPGKRR